MPWFLSWNGTRQLTPRAGKPVRPSALSLVVGKGEGVGTAGSVRGAEGRPGQRGFPDPRSVTRLPVNPENNPDFI